MRSSVRITHPKMRPPVGIVPAEGPRPFPPEATVSRSPDIDAAAWPAEAPESSRPSSRRLQARAHREDSSFHPLYLLIPGEESRASGRGAAAALIAAERFSAARPVILLDLDPGSDHLRGLVGSAEGEGLTDALEFGISLSAAGTQLANGVRFVSTGRLPVGGIAALYAHAGWPRLLTAARRRGIRLLGYAPADETLSGLVAHADAGLLLAGPEEEIRLRGRLPATLKIVGTIEPPVTSAPQQVEKRRDSDERIEPSSADEPSAPADPQSVPAPPIRPEEVDAPAPPLPLSFGNVLEAVTTSLDRLGARKGGNREEDDSRDEAAGQQGSAGLHNPRRGGSQDDPGEEGSLPADS